VFFVLLFSCLNFNGAKSDLSRNVGKIALKKEIEEITVTQQQAAAAAQQQQQGTIGGP